MGEEVSTTGTVLVARSEEIETMHLLPPSSIPDIAQCTELRRTHLVLPGTNTALVCHYMGNTPARHLNKQERERNEQSDHFELNEHESTTYRT
jgi:hypothetical protein